MIFFVRPNGSSDSKLESELTSSISSELDMPGIYSTHTHTHIYIYIYVYTLVLLARPSS